MSYTPMLTQLTPKTTMPAASKLALVVITAAERRYSRYEGRSRTHKATLHPDDIMLAADVELFRVRPEVLIPPEEPTRA